ncbi:MAG TPA: hypothetical protein VK183_07970 [Flavobacterium sp.]|nr:hypothetical protein [Flavobacterium sp.]
MKKRLIRIVLTVALLGMLGAGIWYAQLTTRHKAIVKTWLLQHTGIADASWKTSNASGHYRMVSPTFLVDGIYKSMEGPKASSYVQLTPDSSLIWITRFDVKAFDAKSGEQLSNDFICHTNIDFNDAAYFSSFGLHDRVGQQYPRMTSLSHGLEDFALPKGFGIPMKGNELLYVTTETLNHNDPDIRKWVRHEIDIDYARERLKPLMSRTVFIQLPYDKADPFKGPLDPGATQCLPVETKNHSYTDPSGQTYSGHWVIPPGKRTYRASIDDMLRLKDSARLHAAALHVHPFATRMTLRDVTTGKTVFESTIRNHRNRIGIDRIGDYVSEAGTMLYANHSYELVLETDNTTAVNQDMMGSAFLFFYDAELDQKINTKKR